MANSSVLSYPLDKTQAKSKTSNVDLRINFIPFKSSPLENVVLTQTKSVNAWEPPNLSDNSTPLDFYVSVGQVFDISIPPEFRKIISLPLPASSLNESNSHSWDSGDLIENIKDMIPGIKKVVSGYESIAGKMLQVP